MNKIISSYKPSPLPLIKTIPEHLAKGKLKSVYNKTKNAFDVSWIGLVAMAFAYYPNFYKALWNYMSALSNSYEFNR